MRIGSRRGRCGRALAVAGAMAAGWALPVTAGAATFSNTAGFDVADGTGGSPPYSGGEAGIYPSDIAVSGMSGGVTRLTVTLSRISHGRPDDLDVLLVGPRGQNLVLLSDSGEDADVSNYVVTLDDSAPSAAPDTTGFTDPTYRPTDNFGGFGEETNGDPFPAPAPGPPRAATLMGAFGGTDPNGTWSLYVIDDRPGETGVISGGWALDVESSTSPPPPPPPPPVVRPPVSFFTISPIRPLAGGRIVLDPSRSVAFGSRVARWDWDVDGRSPVTCFANAAVSILGLTAGTHTLNLTATDTAGNFSRFARTVAVAPIVTRPRLPRAPVIRCIQAPYDVRAKGIEVTQGIQTRTPEAKGGELPSYFRAEQAIPGRPAPVPYSGVRMAEHAETIVRFFADSANAPVEGTVALLRGYRGGSELPGSPLLPKGGPTSLRDAGCACVTAAERHSGRTAQVFVLPDSWTEGTINLAGELLPPNRFFDANGLQKGPRECGATECLENNRFSLSGIPFLRTPWVAIQPVRLTTAGQAALPNPDGVFAPALNLVPGGNRFRIAPYGGDVDVTAISNYTRASAECAPYLPANREDKQDKFGDCKNDKYFEAVGKWEQDNRGLFDVAVGVNAQERGKGSQVDPVKWSDSHPISLVNISRPLTSVAHEVGHNLGRPHAGTDAQCPGGDGVAWAPDDRGYIQGVGLDRRRTVRDRIFGNPYRILAPGLTGQPTQWYDLMSYCANSDETGGGDSWVSTRFWDDYLRALNDFGRKVGFGLRIFARLTGVASAAKAGTSGALRVQASIDARGAHITSVSPVGRLERSAGGGPYRLVGRDASGVEVASVPMALQSGHSEPGSAFTFLQGDLPAARVASVAVVGGAGEIASRTRSARAPGVRVLGPRAGAVVGRTRTVSVAWQASDADGGTLDAAIAYSIDDGRTWRTVYVGPSSGRATLPSAYFAGSRRARVRVSVDDGFNRTSAVSGRFRALGRPPDVRIDAPAAGTILAGNATLSLRGHAFDDTVRLLPGNRLAWFLGTRRIARGANAAVTGLPPGRRRISLVATDASGRRGAASVVVTVQGAAPLFLTVRAPRTLSRSARVVGVRVASSLPATLRVGAQRAAVDRRARTIPVRIAPGRGVLRLRLRLTAFGRSTVHVLQLTRR